MTSAQRWYLLLVAGQHAGSDNPDEIFKFLDADGHLQQDLVDVNAASVVIDTYRHRDLSGKLATDWLKREVLRLSRQSNFHDKTLKTADLIAKIEERDNVKWADLSAASGLRLLDAYRNKKKYVLGYR